LGLVSLALEVLHRHPQTNYSPPVTKAGVGSQGV
jgi:hypothetical protein